MTRRRLPDRLQHLVNRAVPRVLSGVPGPVKRVLSGGRAIVVDGNTLDPSLHAFVHGLRVVGRPSLVLDGDIATSRRNLDDASRIFGGLPAPVTVTEVTVDGGSGPLRAWHYRPADNGDDSPRPLLVAYHGGGWVLGDLEGWDAGYRQICRDADVHVLSVDYRLAPEHPAPAAVEDAHAAYLWAVEHAAELGADPTRVAVGGDSAGGCLAAVVARQARDAGDPAPVLQLLLYPVTDIEATTRSRTLFGSGFFLTGADIDFFERCYLGGTDVSSTDPRVSPLLTENLRGLAPALVITAGFDPLRDEGIAYANRLAEAGVDVDLRVYGSMIHGFMNLNGFGGGVSRAITDVISALRAQLSRS